MNNFVSHPISLAIALGVLGSTSALAQEASSVYAGISYSQIDFEGIDGKPAMVAGIVGAPVGEYFAVEGRFGAGVKSVKDSTFVNGVFVTAELKVKSYYGGFVRGTLPVGDSFNLYAILGYGSGKAEATTNIGLSGSDSESSEAYGIGAEFVFGQSKTNHLAFEWARYFEDTNAISIIYRVKF